MASTNQSSTKSKGKIKGKTFDINDFLASQPRLDWAKEMEDVPYVEPVTEETTGSAPATTTIPDFGYVPTISPFLAHVGNLPLDTTESDLADIFRHLKIKDIYVVQQKGFGYVEFDTREDLISALSLARPRLRNRDLRVAVADKTQVDRRDRGGGGGDRSRFFDRGSLQRMSNDARLSYSQRPSSAASYGRPNRSSAMLPTGDRSYYGNYPNVSGPQQPSSYTITRSSSYTCRIEPPSSDYPEPPRYGYDPASSTYNGYDSDREPYRRGSLEPRPYPTMKQGSYSSQYSFEPDSSYYGRSSTLGRDRRQYRRDRYQRIDSASDIAFAPRRDLYGRPLSGYDMGDLDLPPRPDEVPKERKKLELMPRSRPLSGETPAPATPAKSSIFGEAKPVDTAAKEREIEERLERQRQEFHHKLEMEQEALRYEIRRSSRAGSVCSVATDYSSYPPHERRRNRNHSSSSRRKKSVDVVAAATDSARDGHYPPSDSHEHRNRPFGTVRSTPNIGFPGRQRDDGSHKGAGPMPPVEIIRKPQPPSVNGDSGAPVCDSADEEEERPIRFLTRGSVGKETATKGETSDHTNAEKSSVVAVPRENGSDETAEAKPKAGEKRRTGRQKGRREFSADGRGRGRQPGGGRGGKSEHGARGGGRSGRGELRNNDSDGEIQRSCSTEIIFMRGGSGPITVTRNVDRRRAQNRERASIPASATDLPRRADEFCSAATLPRIKEKDSPRSSSVKRGSSSSVVTTNSASKAKSIQSPTSSSSSPKVREMPKFEPVSPKFVDTNRFALLDEVNED